MSGARAPARRRAAPPATHPMPLHAHALTRRGRLAVAGALLAAWAALFAPQVFQGHGFVLGDARVYRPFGEFSRARWTALHERTHWNPYVLAGIPASASLADHRPQYLPDALIDLTERIRPGRWLPLGAPLLVHLIGMLAMAGLARALTGTGPPGMVFAGLAWGLQPELVVPFAFGHDAKLVTLALLPAALLAVHRAIAARDARGSAGAALAFALVFTFQILTGHPQFVVYAGLATAAFALVEAWSARRPLRLAWLAGGAALAVATGAGLWWPALLYGAHSFRGGGGVSVDEVRALSLAWRDLLALPWPQAVGGQGMTYWGGLSTTVYPRTVGVVVALLAALAIVRGALRDARGRLWLGLALFGAVFAMGVRLGPLYGAFTTVVPFAARFRVASAVLCVSELALVLLAAAAFAPALAAPSARPREGGARTAGSGWMLPAAGALAALFAAGLATGVLGGVYATIAQSFRPEIPTEWALRAARWAGLDLLARVAFAAAALALVMGSRGTDRLAGRAGWALVALLAVDLGSVSLPAARRSSAPAALMGPRAEPLLARVAAPDSSVRVWSTRPMPRSPQVPDADQRMESISNDWVDWRVRQMAGDHGAPPVAWRSYQQVPPTFGSVQALGVTYVSAPPGPPFDSTLFAVVARAPDEVVYRIRGALGRAYAVGAVLAGGDDARTMQLLGARDFDPAHMALASDPEIVGPYPGSAGARLTWRRDDPDFLALDIAAPDPAFVVVADTYAPGWTATVDGRATPIHRVDLLARGVEVPGGAHRLEMRYEPEGWRRGVALTRAGLLAGLLAALGWLAWRLLPRRQAATG